MLPSAEAQDELSVCFTIFSASPTSVTPPITQLTTNGTKQNEWEQHPSRQMPPAEDTPEHNQNTWEPEHSPSMAA